MYHKRRIAKLTKDGKIVIEEYESSVEAARKNDIFQPNIINCAKGKIPSYKGFKWKFLDVNYEQKISVIQFTMDGYIVNIYESISEASHMSGVPKANISSVINGKFKQAGKFLWKKTDEFSQEEIIGMTNDLIRKMFIFKGKYLNKKIETNFHTVDNVFEIIRILSKKEASKKELIRVLGISNRTFFRLISSLRNHGFNIVFENDKYFLK